jgi:hypothetical protein
VAVSEESHRICDLSGSDYLSVVSKYLSTRPRPEVRSLFLPVPRQKPFPPTFCPPHTPPWTGPASTISAYDSSRSRPGCAALAVCLSLYSFFHFPFSFFLFFCGHGMGSLTLAGSLAADRRPIDPPPIVQLRVIDKARKNLPSPSPSPPPTQHHQQPPSHPHAQQHAHESSVPLDTSMLTPAGFGAGPFLQNPYYFMFASLAKPDDDTELHWMKVRSDYSSSSASRPLFTSSFIPQDGKTRCTTGSVVSSLYHLKDSENDNRDAGFFVFPDLSVRQEGSYRLKLSLFEVVGCVPTFPFRLLPSSHSLSLLRCLS